MTKEFALSIVVNAIILLIVTMWIKYIGNKIIKVISDFELELEKNFVKKKDFEKQIDDAKEGRKNIWSEFRAVNKSNDDSVNKFSLKFTQEITEIKTILKLKGDNHG